MDIKEIKFLLTHSSIYGVGTILARMVAFIMLPIYTRHLTPADYGVLEMIDTSNILIGLVVTVGISRAMSRFYYEEEQLSYRNTVVSTTYVIAFFLSLLLFPVLFYLSPIISKVVFSSELYEDYFIVSFISLFLGFILDIGMMNLRLKKKPVHFISISISRLCILIGFNIWFVVFLHKGVMGILLSTLITRSVYSIFLTSIVLWQTKLRFSYQLGKKIVNFSLPLIPANLFSTVIKQSDKYFILYLMTVADAGIYSLALKLGNTIHILVTMPLVMAYIPRRFEIMGRKESGHTYQQVFSYYSFIFIFIGLSLSVFTPEVMRIMTTPNFYEAGAYVPLVVFSMFLFGSQYHFDFGILYSQKTKYLAYINFLVAGIHVGLNYILIKQFGIWGAVLASVAAIGFQTALYLLVSNRYYMIEYELKRILGCLGMAVIFYFMAVTISLDQMMLVIFLKLMVLGAFIAALMLLKIITPDESRMIKKIISRMFMRKKPIRT